MRNLLVFIMILSFSCSSLSQNIDDYRRGYIASYNYIEGTIHLKRMIDTLRNACLKLGATPDGFSATLHVSQHQIPNDINLVLCDYIKKKYNVREGCAKLFGTNSTIVKHVRDSINMSDTKKRELKAYSVREVIPEYLSTGEKGYILFFSRISGNTLSAELMSFCDSYKEGRNWYGASKIFYFTFNKNWEIEDVFIGKKNYQ